MIFLNGWSIDIEKIPKYTNFNGIFYQQLDTQLCNLILESTNPVFTEQMKTEFKKYVVDNIQNDGILKVKHYQANKLGRFYATDNKSIIPISKHIKHTIFKYLNYVDLDQSKGHATIASSIGDLNNKDFKSIKKYIHNFDDICVELIQYYSIPGKQQLNKSNIKDLFNMMLYGGGINTWIKSLAEDKPNKSLKGFQIQSNKTLHNFVLNFKNECKELHELIISNNKQLCHKIHDNNKTQYENNSSVCSYWFQIIENHALYIAYNFLVKQKIINPKHCCLEYDGLCIPANDFELTKQILLNNLNSHIHKKCGIHIQYKWKEYDDFYVDKDIINLREKMEDVILTDEEIIDKNDSNYVFKQLYPEFEKTHAKIINISSFIKETDDKVVIFNEKQLISAYKHIECGFTKMGLPVNFIDKWTSFNDKIRQYDNVEIYPDASKCPNNIYNLWRPFTMQLIKEPFVLNVEYQEAVVFVLNHIKILCNNDNEVFEYFIKWIAQMIQFPDVKSICPTLISKEGSGKGSFIYLMQRMLGNNKVFETTDPSREVWGHFNGMMGSCFLVNLNELSKKDTIDCMGKIKGLITDASLTINNKGINQYKITSYHRFIITTNNEEPIETKDGDRRNLIIRSSDEKKGDADYFNKLFEYLNDDNIIRHLFEYFKQIPDMKDFNKLKIPITQHQTNLKQLSKTPPELWLENFTLENYNKDEVKLTGTEIFNHFNDWSSNNGFKETYHTNSLKLGIKIANMNIEGIGKSVKGRDGNYRVFDITKLKKHFNIIKGEGCLIKMKKEEVKEINNQEF